MAKPEKIQIDRAAIMRRAQALVDDSLADDRRRWENANASAFAWPLRAGEMRPVYVPASRESLLPEALKLAEMELCREAAFAAAPDDLLAAYDDLDHRIWGLTSGNSYGQHDAGIAELFKQREAVYQQIIVGAWS